MSYTADLHLHSRFSRACSQDLNLDNLSYWAKLKGIDLLATGDCLHPVWLQELKQGLQAGETGIFSYQGTRFILSTEVACIYQEENIQHKIHLLLYFPSFKSVDVLSKTLIHKGFNLSSDARPILNLSLKQLAQIVFENDPKSLVIPAHIWTPWFGLYGSKSGYDFFTQAFGRLSPNIFAIETGLSSDPALNWQIAELDSKTILSFSDAHSLPRLGRELTIFNGTPTYDELVMDIKKQNIKETIEFYPQEGKYFFSGHRKCGIALSPQEVTKKGGICPVCTRKSTIGVSQRVTDLATRTDKDLELIREGNIIRSATFKNRPPFRQLVQLEKIIAESFKVGEGSKKVRLMYTKLVTNLDNEINLLINTSLKSIESVAGEKITQGIAKVRRGDIAIEPGYDGLYGQIKIWD